MKLGTWRISGALAVTLALLASGLSAPAMPGPQALSVSDCSIGGLGDVMAVYLASPAPRATPIPVPAGASTYLSYVLRNRLAACRAQLGWPPTAAHAMPPPSSRAIACWPSLQELRDTRLLWTLLNFCVSLVKPPSSGGPQGTPWEIPAASGSGFEHVIFVVGLGGDQAMQGKLISTLTTYLNQAGASRWYHFVDNATFVPEPTWLPPAYADICSSSPNIDGTLMVQITAAGAGSSDRFFSRRNWSAIEATAIYAQCTGGLHRSTAYVWASQITPQEGHSNTLTLLTPLALLLTLGSSYEIFAPARGTSVTSTRVFRNPATPSPPPSGRVTQISTTNSTTYNASSLASLSTSFLGSSINYTSNVTSQSAVPTVDELTWNTLQSLAIKLMTQMNCWAPGPVAQGAPHLRDVIGSERALPAYNAPPGLGSYSSGKPSAPFCAEPAQAQSVQELQPSTPRQ